LHPAEPCWTKALRKPPAFNYTDFINDGVVNVLGAAGKTTLATFNANVRSSTSFVNAYDTPLGKSISASGNKQGLINLEGGTGSVRAVFTGNESDQVIRAHNAVINFLESETSKQPRAWGGEIDLEGNTGILLSPNHIILRYPIGAVPGDPDYTQAISLLGPVVHGFDSTDSLAVNKQTFNYAYAVWNQTTHILQIINTLNPSTNPVAEGNLLATYTLDGNWQQSDFKVSYVATNSFDGYWQVTTTNDSNSPGVPLFDRAYYLAQNPGVKAAGINPLVHFEQTGWLEGRDPSAAFSVSRYEAAYPTVRAAGVNPLLDYLTGGQAAGRAAQPVVAGPAPAYKFLITDSATGTSGGDNGTAYTGPTAGLQQQYLWASPADAAITATTPNVFLRGGTGNDALQVQGGTNVLDGGAGSNFLTGGTGADGGTDTFFVDGRGGASTWSTIVNFHHGDSFTLFGFTAGTSTQPWTALDGAGRRSGPPRGDHPLRAGRHGHRGERLGDVRRHQPGGRAGQVRRHDGDGGRQRIPERRLHRLGEGRSQRNSQVGAFVLDLGLIGVKPQVRDVASCAATVWRPRRGSRTGSCPGARPRGRCDPAGAYLG